jgi:hypothetical protein
MAGMVKILRADGTVLRVRGLDRVAELAADGLVAPADRLFGNGRGVVKLADLDGMAFAFATAADEDPYASYELCLELTSD